MEILIQSALCSLAILFIHTLYKPGMILNFIDVYFDNHNLPEWVAKPLYSCIICMAPWWGALYYAIFVGGFNVQFLLSVGGINIIIDRLIYGE